MSINDNGDNDGLVKVEGTLTINHGMVREQVQFRIDAEYGYQQWGNTNEVLSLTTPVVQAMVEALQDAEIWADPDLDS